MEQHRLFNVCEVERLRQQVTDLLGAMIARKPKPSDEIGWLIEWPATADSQPRWWHPVRGWTIDASRGARFSRKEDAEAFIASGTFVATIIATEHAWVNLPVSDAA